jgi:D-sedoheptulose 7-phosphate isomerase
VEDHVNDYVGRLQLALDALPRDAVAELGEILFRAYRNDKQVFVIGNGGSASTASHMAADLAKNTILPNMRRFRIHSLNDNMSIMSALANDLGYEHVFSEQLKNSVRAGGRRPSSRCWDSTAGRPESWPISRSSWTRATTASSRTFT